MGKANMFFYLDHYQLLVNVYHTHRGTSHFIITRQQLSVVNLFCRVSSNCASVLKSDKSDESFVKYEI